MIVDKFVDWAHTQLHDSEVACEYLLGRGISEDQWSRHRIGFVGGDFSADPHSDPGHSDKCFDKEKKHERCDTCHFMSWSSTWEEPEDGGRKVQRVGHRLVGGIVFPLTSYIGQAVGFQIRSLERKEYDTFVIRRRSEGYFFGIGPNMESIWTSREICLVEGSPDQLVIERLVRPDVVALTTSSAGVLQMRFLRRFIRRVYLCLDMDKAGRDGVKNFIDRYSTEFDIVNVKFQLPGINVKDVNDLWKAVGDDRFSHHMRSLMRS